MKSGLLLSLPLGFALLGIPNIGSAQTSGNPGTPAPTTPTTPRTPTPNPSPTPQPRPSIEQQQQIQDFQRNIYISGKVMLDDGTPPPEPVLIERVCNGTPRPEGYTNSKGHFSFQLGQNNAVFADASIGSMNDPRFGSQGSTNRLGSSGGVNLSGCELRAQLPGFRSDTVDLFGKRAMENPDVGTIVLHRLAKVEGYTFSATSTMAPKDAQKAYSHARELLKKEKFQEAEKELVKATTAYPKYAAAWTDLGRLYQSQGKLEEAKTAYQSALAADAKFVSPYQYLTHIAAYEGKWKDTQDMSEKAIKLNPFLSNEVYYFNAMANLQLGNLDAAEQSAREAMKLDPQHHNPNISHVLGITLANKKDFAGAVEQLKFYLKAMPDAKNADNVRKQLAEIERLQTAGITEAKKDDQGAK